MKLSFKTIIITIFIFTLTRVNGPNLWPGFSYELTLKLGFKTIIITTFILTLTHVNGPDPQPGSSLDSSFKTIIITFSLGSTLESSFKTMIIIFLILKLTQVNDQPRSAPCWVLQLYYNCFYPYVNLNQLN